MMRVLDHFLGFVSFYLVVFFAVYAAGTAYYAWTEQRDNWLIWGAVIVLSGLCAVSARKAWRAGF